MIWISLEVISTVMTAQYQCGDTKEKNGYRISVHSTMHVSHWGIPRTQTITTLKPMALPRGL